MSATDQAPESKADSGIWNYHPPVPIGGVFQNLLNPFKIVKGVLFSWFGIYIRGLYLLMIASLWFTIFPSMETIAARD